MNRYLEHYLDEKLEMDGMEIDLANGCCTVQNVRLKIDVSCRGIFEYINYSNRPPP